MKDLFERREFVASIRFRAILCRFSLINLFLNPSAVQVNLLAVIEQLREDRGGSVQTEEQYEYIYRCLIRYARIRDVLNGTSDNTPENEALRLAMAKANR